jgi:hypothetical protein
MKKDIEKMQQQPKTDEAVEMFDWTYFDNCFDLVLQFKNRSFLLLKLNLTIIEHISGAVI